MIANAKIIDEVEYWIQKLLMWELLLLQFKLKVKKKLEYTIVGSAESNPLEGKFQMNHLLVRLFQERKKEIKVQDTITERNVVGIQDTKYKERN